MPCKSQRAGLVFAVALLELACVMSEYDLRCLTRVDDTDISCILHEYEVSGESFGVEKRVSAAHNITGDEIYLRYR